MWLIYVGSRVYLEVIAFPFTVHVGQEENTEDDSNKVPLGEHKVKGMANDFLRVQRGRIERAESYQCGYLEQADL